MATTSRSPFAAPGESGRRLWRALGEVTGAAVLMFMTQLGIQETTSSSSEVQLLLGTVVFALLAVRRRWPTVSLLGVSAVMGQLPAAGLPAAVIAYTAAKQLAVPRRRTAVLLASTVLTVLICAVSGPAIGLSSHTLGLALGGVLAATTLIVPGLVGTAGGQQDRLLEALRERAVAAEAARRLVDSESRIHERSRIAAEMHDLVGHRLSLISLHTGGLEMALAKDSPELRDEAALVRRATGDAMRELREVLGVLGPLGRDTGTGALTDTTGTRSDVEALSEESRSGGILVDLTWDGPDLNDRAAQVRRAVHRVVRESLTNVHRYATGAHVTVAVRHTDDRVEVLVRNGHPPVPPEASTGLGSGRGLVGLRERVALLGGTLEADRTQAGGFAVTARIPAQPDPAAILANTDAAPADSPAEPGPERPSAGIQRRVVNGLSGLVGLAGVGVLMLFGLLLVDQEGKESDHRDSEEPRIGMSREKVEDSFIFDSPEVRAAATGREPARAESLTACIYPQVMEEDFVPLEEEPAPSPTQAPSVRTDEGAGHLKITRYCFRGDKLAAIDDFTVPVVSQTPPWESP